jgi:hypothetical protein
MFSPEAQQWNTTPKNKLEALDHAREIFGEMKNIVSKREAAERS